MYCNNKRTGKDATKPRTLNLLGHSVAATLKSALRWLHAYFSFASVYVSNDFGYFRI